jgi:hypothetical protein
MSKIDQHGELPRRRMQDQPIVKSAIAERELGVSVGNLRVYRCLNPKPCMVRHSARAAGLIAQYARLKCGWRGQRQGG